ncbi:zinc finger protein 830-like [Ornithodoros turicata]|uniref:zinc finger protein 830-like n=1 Tax=Ornithodoros turicata TaxID=34597 RepID=UPI003139BBFB
MAAPSRGKAVSKNDLKRLMKERKDALCQSTKRINSPYAKYNSLGHLLCTVCSTQVKSETLWATHVLGKTHKENLDQLKRKTSSTTGQSTEKLEFVCRKRLKSDGEAGDPAASTCDVPAKKTRNANLLSFDASDDEQEGSEGKDESSALPSDFFDKPTNNSQEPSSKPKGSKDGESSLPEGFFDDPFQDAKARNVEYKDPVEEEWEKFQKAIAEETTVSEAIMEEDAEESKVERDIEEIDEQIHNWSRVENLQKRKEDLMKNEVTAMDEDGENESDMEGQDFDEYLNWRAKGAWK